MAITKYSALRNVLKDEEEEQKKKSSALTTLPKKTTTTTSAQTTSSSPTLKSLLKKSESSTAAKTPNETPKKTESTSKTLSFSEALKATPSTVKTTGEQLDKVRENVQKTAKTTTAASGSKTVDISAWKNALSDEDTVSRVKASREIAASALANRNTPAKQKETKDALALRNQEAKIAALRKEEEAKKKAYEKLPILDKVFNISAEVYASNESRLREAAEVEYDRMRMTPEEFEEQHKADLGESLYQIAHSGATGVAGSFARAADVGTAIVSGAKEALDGGSFVKGYQEAISSDDSLYNQVYEQYEREYEENRRLDGEVNTLTKYASQAAQSVGEQAVMLWTASMSSALYGGSKIAGAIASKADDLISSGKKGLKLVGKALGKVDAGKLGGAASMLITSSASATEQAINDMRAVNEKRHSLGRVAAYSDETIVRNAALYGVLNGLSETVLEYAIGGVTGAAGSALPSPKVKNPILTATLSYLKGAAGEGFEEVVQTLSSTGLEKLTYNENASIDWQEVIDSGIVGALSGAAMGVPAAVQNTKFGVSAMRDVSSAVKAAKKAETDAAGAFVAVSSTAKAQAYSEIAEDIRKTGSENAETLASVYEWAAEQHLKVAETLTGDTSRAEVQEKAKKENKKQAKREAEQTASAAERDANAAASVNPTAEEVPNADVNAIDREANTFERDVNTPLQTAETPVTAPVEASNATTSPEAVSSTQTPAQEETASVQNKIRAEALQSENVSAENGGATVVTDFALQLQRGASKNTNLKTVQKLADAVRIVQSGQMPDKTYNEALNLLKNASVRGMVETELGSDTVIDPKHIRISLETVSKRYAETAERADMDSLSEEITSVVERSAEDKVTIADGQMTRAEFVRSFGAELAQRGLAADDVFDRLLAYEREVNAPIQNASEMPNADVNAIDHDVNVFEHDVNTPIQTAEMPVMTASEMPNADANAITSDVNAITSAVSRETIPVESAPKAVSEANTLLQAADTPVTVASEVPNADVNAIEREANTFERDVNTPLQTAEMPVMTASDTPNGDANAITSRLHRQYAPDKVLTDVQQASVDALDRLASAVNVDIYLYDSETDPEYAFSSGRYETDTDRVYIDINAGDNYEGTMLYTAAHELLHFARNWSQDGFAEVARFAEQIIADNGVDIGALIDNKITAAASQGVTLSRDTAYEEVIADACQSLLTDTNALARLEEQNKTLFDRVVDFVRDFIGRIRTAYKGYKPTTEAGRIVYEQQQETLDRLSALYTDALIRAGQARTEAQQFLSGESSALDSAKTEQGSVLFDYRAVRQDRDTYERMLRDWGGMSEGEISELMAMLDRTLDIVEQYRDALDYGYESDLNEERPFKPVKPNSDPLYKVSVDFSTLCRKRIVQMITATKLQEALRRPISREESVQIREALTQVQQDAKQIEVACALCYVEAARLRTPAQIQKFMDNRAEVLYNYYANHDDATKAEINDAAKAAKAADDATKETVRAAKAAARGSYVLTDAQREEIAFAEHLPLNTFTDPRALAKLARLHPDIFAAYAGYARAASHAKGLEADVPWRAGDSDAITDYHIADMNEGAGLRSQSWSDFQVMHLLDEIVMTVELASRGAKMHSYTKVPDYVRLLGKTGHVINMSLIPTRDGNGFDAVEGMPYEVMLMLRDQYPEMAGNVCIGVNDAQITELLDSDEIDYVIPYHSSGLSKVMRGLLNIPEWSSYQAIQSEKGGKGPAFAEWFDLDRARETAARENESPTDPAAKEKYGVQYGAYKAMQEAADRYLEICAERGLTPKFKGKVEGRNVDFTIHPNYWKLLIDRKMVNQVTGEVIEQKPVRPIFDPKVIYGDPANENVGGILGQAIAQYPGLIAETNYAVDRVTRDFLSGKGISEEVISEVLSEPITKLWELRIRPESAPRSSERDIASSPEFEAFIKAYDAVHGEGAARTIVRTTEQFDRERARQRKRERTAAQMARLPETEKRIAAEVKRLEADRRQREKIETLKNPKTRKRRLAAQKNRALMRELLEAAKQNADMRVADQAYRDNVEMKVRLAEAQQRAEERLKGVSNNLRWTAEARAYEAKQTADERVRQAVEYGKERVKTEVQRTKDRQARQDYADWWDENFFKKQDAEIRDTERQERKAYQNEISQLVRKRDRQILEDNAEVRSAQLGYARDIRTDPEALRNRSNEAARENAAMQELQHQTDFAARQAEAVQRTGASVISPTDAVRKTPVVESDQSAPLEHGFAEKQGSPFGKSVGEKVKAIPGKIRDAGSKGYRTFVNSAQGIDNVADKQRKMGFKVTASDLITSVRNAKDSAAYILTDALVNQNGEALGESLSDIILVKDEHGKFDKKGQRVFDAYLKLVHHIDRMSIRDNAFRQLQEYLNEHEWLRPLFPTEAPQPIDTRGQAFIDAMLGRSDAEIREAFTAAELYNTYADAKNKPVLGSVETVTDVNGEKHIREINVVSVEQARAELALYEAEQDWLKGKADKYYQWWDTFMREWAVGTSITIEDYEKMHQMYPHYVPTFREGKDSGAAASTQGGKISSGKAVKKATGGVSEVRWVQDTLAEQVARLVTLRRTNDLLLNLIDTGLLDGSDSLGTGIRIRPESLGYGALMNAQEVDGDNPIARAISNEGKGYSISAWDNGQRITADIDDGLYKSLQSLFPQGDMIGKLTQIGRTVSSPMKAFITGYNPFFIIRNIGRDFGTALIQTEGSVIGYMGHYGKAYWHILTRNPRWEEYKALGNTGSQRYRDDVGLAKFDKIMSPNARNFVKKFLGAVGETTEAAARYAEYLLVAEKGGFTPDAKIRASKAAAEITTDFSRSGEFGKFLNAWIPYSNAATQGVDRVLRDFSHGKTAWTRLYRSVILQAVPAAILSIIIKRIGREDEYDQISDYQKDNYYLVPIQDGKWLRIPKTETYGKLLASGVSRAFEAAWGREDPYKDFRDVAGEAFNQSWTGADDALEGISDFLGFRDIAVAGSIIDLLMNKDFAGRDIVPSQFKDFSSGKFAPRSEQYDNDTSLIAYGISNMIANAFSPIEVDYLIRDYFGDFVHAIASIPKVGMLEAFSWQDLANDVKETAISEVSGAFVVDPVYSNRYTGEYYDMLDAMAAQIAADKIHLPEGEHKNTLTYRTKQAIENKYGKDISAAYKTARSAVSEAQKRDAREEAVRLSIEALDFYEQAMAGKYGDDPSKYVDYEPYGEDVCEALLKLTQYEEDYSFEPNDSYAPSSLSVDKVKYELTPEQRDEYKAMYVGIYAGHARRTILSQEYRLAGGRRQAEMLEDAASDARAETTSRMKNILSGK